MDARKNSEPTSMKNRTAVVVGASANTVHGSATPESVTLPGSSLFEVTIMTTNQKAIVSVLTGYAAALKAALSRKHFDRFVPETFQCLIRYVSQH